MDWLRHMAADASAHGYISEIFAYGFVVNALIASFLIGPMLGG